MKKDIENNTFKENDTGVHLSLADSYSARQRRRLAQSFESPEQARERVFKTSPKIK